MHHHPLSSEARDMMKMSKKYGSQIPKSGKSTRCSRWETTAGHWLLYTPDKYDMIQSILPVLFSLCRSNLLSFSAFQALRKKWLRHFCIFCTLETFQRYYTLHAVVLCRWSYYSGTSSLCYFHTSLPLDALLLLSVNAACSSWFRPGVQGSLEEFVVLNQW